MRCEAVEARLEDLNTTCGGMFACIRGGWTARGPPVAYVCVGDGGGVSSSSVRSMVLSSCACDMARLVGILKSNPSPTNLRGRASLDSASLIGGEFGKGGGEGIVRRRFADGEGVTLRLWDLVICSYVRWYLVSR